MPVPALSLALALPQPLPARRPELYDIHQAVGHQAKGGADTLRHLQARQVNQLLLQFPHRQRVVDRHVVELRGPGPEILHVRVAAEVRFLLPLFEEGVVGVADPERIHIVVVEMAPPVALGRL